MKTPRQLRAHINPLTEFLPLTSKLEKATGVGVGFDGAWYRSQKEHWLGWLAEYDGPGAYGRSNVARRTGEFIYNHIQCAPMLFWLAEALEADKERLDAAFRAIVAIQSKGAPQCAALRRHIPWHEVARLLDTWPYDWKARLKIRLSLARQ